VNGRLVFTATDRTDYFEAVCRSWAAVPTLPAWTPQVFLEPTPAADVMTGLAREHLDAAVVVNPRRHGVLHNPWVALETMFNSRAEFIVLAEDDIIVSTDILDYFTWAARRFADEHILAVSACSFYETCPPGDEHTVVAAPEFCPLVWGTWADRWYGVLRDSWDHDYSSGTATDPQSGWDWNLNLRVIPAGNWMIALPRASRASHIGAHGTHTTPESYPGSVAATYTPYREPVAPQAWCFR